jgi:hypothetical protein
MPTARRGHVLPFVALLAAFNEIRHAPGFEKLILAELSFCG